MLNKLQILSEYANKHDSLQAEVDELKRNIEIYSKILILPGVEFEAYPGIHMLYIFDPSCDLDSIDNFLKEAGYHQDKQGCETPEGTWCTFGVPESLEKVAELGGIAIAAHADSSKGLYETLDGTYRVQAFVSEHLTAIQYTNPKNLERIKSLFLNKPYDARKVPIAFLQCSDYHGEEGERKAGSCITFLKLSDFTFNSVREALYKPDTCVSPMVRPEDDEIINKLAKEPYTVLVENVEGENIQLLLKAICAQINSDKGRIIIGVTPKYRSIVGVELQRKDIFKIIYGVADDSIYPSLNSCFVDVNEYACGSERIVYVIMFRKETRDIYALKNENKAYIMQDIGVKEASPQDIANIAERRLFRRMERHQEVNERKINSLLKDFKLLGDNMRQFLLFSRIERISVNLLDMMNIKIVEAYEGDFDTSDYPPNGCCEGNLIYLSDDEPRSENIYLRCSAPRYNIKLEDSSLKIFTGPAIVIGPGGASHYVDIEGSWSVVHKNTNSLAYVLQFEEFYRGKSYLGILGWLKSSLALWYSYCCQGDINLSRIDILAETPIPNLVCLNVAEKVEITVKSILQTETEYLKATKDLKCSQLESDEQVSERWEPLVDCHNTQVAILAKLMDTVIHEEFHISEEEEEMISDFFDMKSIFNLFNIEEDEYCSEGIEQAAATIN